VHCSNGFCQCPIPRSPIAGAALVFRMGCSPAPLVLGGRRKELPLGEVAFANRDHVVSLFCPLRSTRAQFMFVSGAGGFVKCDR
jgi:hypothetical protein